MYANVVEVSVDTSVDPERKGLNEVVIPRVRQMPGVVAGHWLEPTDGEGVSVVVFKTERAAREAIEVMGLKQGASPAPGSLSKGSRRGRSLVTYRHPDAVKEVDLPPGAATVPDRLVVRCQLEDQLTSAFKSSGLSFGGLDVAAKSVPMVLVQLGV